MNLATHETLPAREALSKIWDVIPAGGSVAELERKFTALAIARGFTAEQCEHFLLGSDA